MNPATLERFFGWINERHAIYLKKEAGEPWPWTNDEILRTYKFTNPFRENDRDTKWMRKYWNKPEAPIGEQLFNVCFFRMFGSTEFIDFHGWNDFWDPEETKAMARSFLEAGRKVFTGAYIITNQGLRLPKEQVVVDYFLNPIWRDRELLADQILTANSLQHAHTLFSGYQGWGGGGFMAYEVVTDFNHTFLRGATDRYTWANAGPGAKRGLNRLHDRPLEGGGKRDWNAEMRELLGLSFTNLGPHITEDRATWDMVDMRCIEHSLCEFDKWERVRLGEGKPRSLYKPNWRV